MRIANNAMALNAHRSYTINNDNTASSAERLSSGYRINKAADDAAGLAISEKMRSQIRGLTMAARNCRDGNSLIQTAEGALSETHSILQRMNELAVQSATGTNDGFDRTQLAKEFEQLKREIDDISDQTTFNNMRLLDGSLSAKGTVRSAYTSGVYSEYIPDSTNSTRQGGINNVVLKPGTPFIAGTPDTLGTIASSSFQFDYSNTVSGDAFTIGNRTYVFYNSDTDNLTDAKAAEYAQNPFMLNLAQITSAASLADAIGGYDAASGWYGAQASVSGAEKVVASVKNNTILLTYAGNAASSAPNVNDLTGGAYGERGTKYVTINSMVNNGSANIVSSVPSFATSVSTAQNSAVATKEMTRAAVINGGIGVMKVEKGVTPYRLLGAACVTVNIDALDNTGKGEIAPGELKIIFKNAAGKVLDEASNVRTIAANAGKYEVAASFGDGDKNFNSIVKLDRYYYKAVRPWQYNSAGNTIQTIQFMCLGSDIDNTVYIATPENALDPLNNMTVEVQSPNGGSASIYRVEDQLTFSGRVPRRIAASLIDYFPDDALSGNRFAIGHQVFTFYDSTVDSTKDVDGNTVQNLIDTSVVKTKEQLAARINELQAGASVTQQVLATVQLGGIAIQYAGDAGVANQDGFTANPGGKYGSAGDPYVTVSFPPAIAMAPIGAADQSPVTPPTPPADPPENPPIIKPVDNNSNRVLPQKKSSEYTRFELDTLKMKANDVISYIRDDGTTVFHTFKTGDTAKDIMAKFGVSDIADGNEWRVDGGDFRYRLKFKPAQEYRESNPLQIQVGALKGEQLAIKIDAVNTAGLNIDRNGIYTQAEASKAITATRSAINKVSDQRALLGAVQNRLNHKIASLNVSIENLQQSESRICDIDIASEMTVFTRNNVLSQAATAMLAQANNAPQNVLSLLR